jgi:capsule polysaccharide export protein KpsC/LpsZ
MREDLKNNTKEINFTEEEKELVILRIETTTSNLRLSIGGGKSMNKEEMIEHVKNGDEIGKQIVKTHLNFLRAVASGNLTDLLGSV